MKRSIFIISTLGCFLFFSCESQNETEKVSEDNVEATVHEEDNEHHAHEHETLKLNDGEKWVINEEMKPNVAAQEESIENYKTSKSTDYKALADQLVKQNSSLINSCTMDGESHDELHNWLHPHMELLEELSQAESEEQAEEVIPKLEASFESFHKYFQ